jgi:hypothetical protein
MKLGKLTNGRNIEYKIQEVFEKWIKQHNKTNRFNRYSQLPLLKYCRELYIKEVSRRPDFLIIKGNLLINVESKCIPNETLIKQIQDNSIYCDYSFILIPDYFLTPEWFKVKITEMRIGVIVYNYKEEIITEVIEAHKNKNVDKELKKKIIKRFKKEFRYFK